MLDLNVHFLNRSDGKISKECPSGCIKVNMTSHLTAVRADNAGDKDWPE